MVGVSIRFAMDVFGMGLSRDLFGLGRQWPLELGIGVVLMGGVVMVGLMLVSLRLSHRAKVLYPSLLVAYFLVTVGLAMWLPAERLPPPMEAAHISALKTRLLVDGVGLFVAVILSYAWFLSFMGKEGKRYFHYRAEVALAGEIHRLLVPPVALTVDGTAFHGESHPSSEVGGDLVDVVSTHDGWLAYIADVSGHGVAPGVVMGMVKSAVRTRVSGPTNAQPLLDHLNGVIHPLKKSNMFVTFAYVAGRGDEVELATAGHPPILHYSAGDGGVSELKCPNLPLGVRRNESFATARTKWEPGDLLVLVTDGLLDMDDPAGHEFGIAGLKRVVEEHGSRPLDELSHEILRAVRSHGPSRDDQSLLLIRRGRR